MEFLIIITIILVGILIIVFTLLALWFANKEPQEIEVKELEPINPLLEQLTKRIEKLENAVSLIEEAFTWNLMPLEGEPQVLVIEKPRSGYTEWVPATLIPEQKEIAKTTILPRHVNS